MDLEKIKKCINNLELINDKICSLKLELQELLPEELCKTKVNPIKSLENFIDSVEDDSNDIWERRIKQHKKMKEEKMKEEKMKNNKSNNPDNLINSELSEPIPRIITPSKSQKGEIQKETKTGENKETKKYPPINALTKLPISERNKVLYNLYQEAKKAVEATNPDESQKSKLINNMTNSLLNNWIKNN